MEGPLLKLQKEGVMKNDDPKSQSATEKTAGSRFSDVGRVVWKP